MGRTTAKLAAGSLLPAPLLGPSGTQVSATAVTEALIVEDSSQHLLFDLLWIAENGSCG